MKRFGLIFFVALACGCQTYRYTYTPDITTGIKTENRYRIQSVKVMTVRLGSGGQEWTEADEFATSIWGFSPEDIKWMHSLNPDVYAENGIPLELKVKVDYDKLDQGSFLMLPYALLCLATLEIIPFASHGDYDITIDVSTVASPDRSGSFTMKEEIRICNSLSGLNLPFPYAPRKDERFSRCGSRNMMSTNSDAALAQKECKFQAYSYAIAATLAKMESEGLIAVDGVSKLGPVARERKKNLDSLLKAGVITEEEYRKELEKGSK